MVSFTRNKFQNQNSGSSLKVQCSFRLSEKISIGSASFKRENPCQPRTMILSTLHHATKQAVRMLTIKMTLKINIDVPKELAKKSRKARRKIPKNLTAILHLKSKQGRKTQLRAKSAQAICSRLRTRTVTLLTQTKLLLIPTND